MGPLTKTLFTKQVIRHQPNQGEIMRRSLNAMAVSAALVATVALAGPAAIAQESITAGGSSAQATLQGVCTAAYTTDKITYTGNSSGTGRNNFLNGTYDFSGADVGYSSTDTLPSNFTYVPVVGVPIAIPFNIDGVKSLNLSAKVLAGILNGRYTTWNDPEIVKLNPAAALPAKPITVVYRPSSGTMQNLSRFLMGNGGSGFHDNGSWTVASGQASPVGLSAGTGALAVSTIKSTPYSIGYADLADAATSGLSFAAIRNPLGAFVKPTVAAAAKFLAAQRVGSDGILDIDWQSKIAGAYNLSMVTYDIAPTKAASASKGTAIRNYLSYLITKCGPSKAAANNYVPLTGALLLKAKALVAKVQ
jgi:phosphate transport system substrate-binding protein